MKSVFLLLSALLAGHAATTNRLFLAWFPYDGDTNITFHVYATTNIALPVNQWPHFTNIDWITATNNAKPGEGGAVEIRAATDFFQFYSITASNFTGEADFSEPVSVRRLLTGTGLRIRAL